MVLAFGVAHSGSHISTGVPSGFLNRSSLAAACSRSCHSSAGGVARRDPALCAIAPITYDHRLDRARQAQRRCTCPLSPLGKRLITATAVVLAAWRYSVYWMFWTAKPSIWNLKFSHDLSEVCGRQRPTSPPPLCVHRLRPHPIAVFARSDTGTSLRVKSTPTYDAPAGFNTDDVRERLSSSPASTTRKPDPRSARVPIRPRDRPGLPGPLSGQGSRGAHGQEGRRRLDRRCQRQGRPHHHPVKGAMPRTTSSTPHPNSPRSSASSGLSSTVRAAGASSPATA